MSAVKRYSTFVGLVAVGLVFGYLAGKLEENVRYEEVIKFDQGANVKEAIEMLNLLQEGNISSVEGYYERKLISSLKWYHHMGGVNCDDPLNSSVYRYVRSFDINEESMESEWSSILERLSACFEEE